MIAWAGSRTACGMARGGRTRPADSGTTRGLNGGRLEGRSTAGATSSHRTAPAGWPAFDPVNVMRPSLSVDAVRRSIASRPVKIASENRETRPERKYRAGDHRCQQAPVGPFPPTHPPTRKHGSSLTPRPANFRQRLGPASGSVSVHRVPWPGCDEMPRLPPLASTSRRAFGSPRPMPRPASRPLKNGSQARSAVYESIPGPSSMMEMFPHSPAVSACAVRPTRPPSCTASKAFTASSRTASPT